jgi:flagellar capping protein FliD
LPGTLTKTTEIINRATALNTQSEQNAARINYLQQRLDVSRERLLNQFYRMELAVGKIQSNLTYISTLQNVASQAATSRR